MTSEDAAQSQEADDVQGTEPVVPGDAKAVSRPFGFVREEPLVRRVGDRDTYIGNVHAADDGATDVDFEQVVSATERPRPRTTHHHPLDDGPDNDWRSFADAVDATRQCLRSEGSTLVHCHAGVSRSATLIATAIAADEGVPFEDALTEIHRRRPVATPHPALRTDAAIYLAALV